MAYAQDVRAVANSLGILGHEAERLIDNGKIDPENHYPARDD